MRHDSVCAVVVTFHPTAEYLGNLAKIRAQAGLLVVVDNGSTATQLAQLRLAKEELDFILLENGANLGIATALNRGVREAQKWGCRWVALFDQDSAVTDGFIATMIGEFETYRRDKPILQIVPRYQDPDTGAERPISWFDDGGIFLTITSGSLFAMRAFDECGLFQESLFIYCVDDDYSLRIHQRGFFIGHSRGAVLLHRGGHPTSRKLLGLTVTTQNYSPAARYYFARNKIWILRRYGKAFPRLILPTFKEFVSIFLKIALIENASFEKIRMFLRGLWDGVVGKTGPLQK